MGRGRNHRLQGGSNEGTHKRALPSRTVLYTRHGYEDQLQIEMAALQEQFTLIDNLEDIQAGDRVICRFSLLPFPELLAQEVQARGGSLVHDAEAHSYLADMRQWYPHLQGLTPRTWFAIEDVDAPGPYFVKGITNSLKNDWQAGYAADFADLERVMAVVTRDPLLAQQPLCIRQFVPLRTYGQHPQTGAPITEEYRCFVAGGHTLSCGYYFSEQLASLAAQGIIPDPARIPEGFLAEVIERIGDRADYYAVDVAQTEDGEWLVIELNDATMSGLAGNDPQELYGKLAECLASSSK